MCTAADVEDLAVIGQVDQLGSHAVVGLELVFCEAALPHRTRRKCQESNPLHLAYCRALGIA